MDDKSVKFLVVRLKLKIIGKVGFRFFFPFPSSCLRWLTYYVQQYLQCWWNRNTWKGWTESNYFQLTSFIRCTSRINWHRTFHCTWWQLSTDLLCENNGKAGQLMNNNGVRVVVGIVNKSQLNEFFWISIFNTVWCETE